MNYTKINNIIGWVVFAIASWVYLSTMEETTSLWDCGEYITTANKLEVGHPPGAPLFMMLGRLFSAFVSPENAAMAVNSMSALSSSFSILFLFWTISMLAKKMALRDGGVLDNGQKIAIFGSAAVGALGYTFTDSFWFSAVEGEVYAMSSFFTALVFWAIFKWEVETEKYNKAIESGEATSYNPNRWLIFIAYMIGLSIGVHLLNLLAIPALGFVIYFQKTKVVELKGMILAGVVSLLTLGIVQSVIIPKIPSVADFFERMFTNDLGMGFNSGFIFFLIVVIGLLTFGILYTSKKKLSIWNNVIVSLTMLLIGYSSFTMIVVRSNANPPLDENNPETLSSLVSYLNRDQYGSWPILYGPYWNTPSMQNCNEGSLEAPKVSFMKAYVATLDYTVSGELTGKEVNAIKKLFAPLGIPLEVAKVGNGYQVNTPKYTRWIKYDGAYAHATAGIASELDKELPFELSFINLFEFELYKTKVKAANDELAQMNSGINLKLADEPEAKYVNMMAGKAGDKKPRYDFEYSDGSGNRITANYTTIFPRMYRTGEGSKYMAWIDYDNHEHSVPLPRDLRLAQMGVEGQTKPEQYSYVSKLALEYNSDEYKQLANDLKKDGMYKPNFLNENISYMFQYQFGWMYFRYFMWNFSGRQNDLQGYGMNGGGKRFLEGNWLTGVDFIDEQRLGSQENLPAFISQNKGYNKYYLLPLILALIGFIFHAVRAPKDMFSVLLLFLLTGFAIVVYLNQKPMEPRERDYAYAASFYAFAVWLGLGVYALFDAARNFDFKNIGVLAAYSFGTGVFIYIVEMLSSDYHPMSYAIFYMSAVGLGAYTLIGFLGHSLKNSTITGATATGLTLMIPILMGVQNWDDHDRSNRSTGRDFAYNYLLSCDKKSEGGKGAIIFTNGDNDTFPLWYLQEVEEVRTDVRVANMSLLGTDWHINQMKRLAYDSEPIDITMNEFSYRNGTRDYIIISEDDAKKYISGKKWVELSNRASNLTSGLAGLKDDALVQTFYDLKVVEKASKMGANFKTKNFAQQDLPTSLLIKMNSADLDSIEKIEIDKFKSVLASSPEEQKGQLLQSTFGQLQNSVMTNLQAWHQVFYPIEDAMSYMLDDNNFSDEYGTCQEEASLNCSKIYITVDKEAALKNGIITKEQMPLVQDTLKWNIAGGVIYKSDLAVLDMFRNYKWDRPIYFASQAGLQANKNIVKYLQSEGLAFKFTPIDFGPGGGVNHQKMYDLMMDKENGFQWGNMKGEGVLVDYYTMRMVYNLRVQIMKFTEELLKIGEKQMAIDVLDRAFEEMPIENHQVAPDDICFYLCATYYEAGAKEKGDALAKQLAQVKLDEISYYISQDAYFFNSMKSEFGKSMSLLEMIREAAVPEASEHRMELQMAMQKVQTTANAKFQEMEQAAKSGVYTTQEQFDNAQLEIEKWYSAEMQKASLTHYENIADPTMTFFNDLGPFEATNYKEVLINAKAKYVETSTIDAAFYAEQRNFPRSILMLWNPSAQ